MISNLVNRLLSFNIFVCSTYFGHVCVLQLVIWMAWIARFSCFFYSVNYFVWLFWFCLVPIFVSVNVSLCAYKFLFLMCVCVCVCAYIRKRNRTHKHMNFKKCSVDFCSFPFSTSSLFNFYFFCTFENLKITSLKKYIVYTIKYTNWNEFYPGVHNHCAIEFLYIKAILNYLKREKFMH